MSLDYLMKKVWHPGSMKNIQIVWDKEQKERQLIRKAEEMKKKLEEERHHDQIRRLQVKAGQIPASQLDRLDWMYEWKGHGEKTAEEYLLGKKITDGKPQKEVKHITKEQITNQICQDFFKIHQDPLFAIKSQEVKARKAIQNNPMKMKQIYDSVEYRPVIKERASRSQSGSSSDSSSQRKRKKAKKEKKQKESKRAKKEKKHKRHHSRSKSSSSSPSSSRERSYRHKRRSSRSPEKQAADKRQRSRQDTYKEAKLKQQRKEYNQFLKSKYGTIAQEDQNGRVRPNFNKFRTKYKTQHQLSEQEKQESRERMMQAGRKVYQQTVNQ